MNLELVIVFGNHSVTLLLSCTAIIRLSFSMHLSMLWVLTVPLRLLLVDEVELFVQKIIDQIQRRLEIVLKGHLHPSSRPPCR